MNGTTNRRISTGCTLCGLPAWLALLSVGVVTASCALSRSGTLPDEGNGATGAGASTTSPTGGNGAGGGTGGTGGVFQCTSPDQCSGTDGECGHRTCVDSQCGYATEPVGTPCTEGGGVKCDGQGHCVECVGADDCVPGTCSGGVQHGGETCQAGSCVVVPDTIQCFPYVCDGDQCFVNCLTQSHGSCVASHYCDGTSCVADKSIGDSCGAPAECPGDRCVDGYCCNTACNGTCEACDLGAGSNGTCTPIPPFEDPDSECSSAFGCNGAGSCASCGFAPAPPTSCVGNPNCDRCDPGNICVIVGDLSDEYENQTIQCPAGFHCSIECGAHHACKNSVIICPADYRCYVECGDNDHQCQGVTVTCSARGACFVNCVSGNTCDSATVNCGDNSCNANCLGAGEPTLVCGSSCNCTPCS